MYLDDTLVSYFISVTETNCNPFTLCYTVSDLSLVFNITQINVSFITPSSCISISWRLLSWLAPHLLTGSVWNCLRKMILTLLVPVSFAIYCIMRRLNMRKKPQTIIQKGPDVKLQPTIAGYITLHDFSWKIPSFSETLDVFTYWIAGTIAAVEIMRAAYPAETSQSMLWIASDIIHCIMTTCEHYIFGVSVRVMLGLMHCLLCQSHSRRGHDKTQSICDVR